MEAIYETLNQMLRILFLMAVPCLLGIAGVGVVVSVLQSATAIRDGSVGYALKLVAAVAVLYVTLPSLVVSLRDFARGILGP